jgi:excisionase family DNA binding protein
VEKFCIVKRRKPIAPAEKTGARDIPDTGEIGGYVANISGNQPTDRVSAINRNRSPSADVNDLSEKSHIVRVVFTPDQCRVVSQKGNAEQLFGRIICDASVLMERNGQDQIALNLHLKYAHSARMLTSRAVCEMLQISRGLLAKLVRGGKLRSYKIGRLRRFLLEDVLEYISRNGDLQKVSTVEPQYRGGRDWSSGTPPQC